MNTPRTRIAAHFLDVAVVVGFVALGRTSHSEGHAVGGIGVVAAPFLVGTATGWILLRRAPRPAGLRAGLIVWACSAGIGLVLRGFAFGRATPFQFVLVGAGVLGVMLLGWRAIWAFVARRRGGARPSAEPASP